MMIVNSTGGSLNEDTHVALLLYANMPANFGSSCNPIAPQNGKPLKCSTYSI